MGVQRFVSGARDQAFLLPPDMREWLGEDHLAWLVVDVVDRLDLSALTRVYRDDGSGRPAYDPAVMTALLFYAYATGERSSRVIERRCVEDVGCRVVAAGLAPDHVTVSRFRRRHADALIELFGQVLRLCRASGFSSVGTVAIDGTKVRANASKERYALGDADDERARRIFAEADARDAAEDALDPEAQAALEGRVGGGLTGAERRERLDRAAAELAADARDGDGKLLKSNQASGRRMAAARHKGPNLTDPDSRVMRGRHGWVQGYNAQVAVTDEHLIVSCDVSTEPTDHRLLEPMIKSTEDALEQSDVAGEVGEYLADSGYWNGAVVDRLAASGKALLVRPNGRPRTPGRGGSQSVTAMHERLDDDVTAGRYRRRQALVEPVIAHIKINRRFDRFLLRGQPGARLEWALACTAHNLLRLPKAA